MRKYIQLLLENNEKLVNLYSSEKMGTCIQVLLQTNEFVVNWIEKIFSFMYPNFNSKFSSNQFRSMNFYSSQKSFLTYIQLLNPKSFQINLNVSVSWNLNYQPKRQYRRFVKRPFCSPDVIHVTTMHAKNEFRIVTNSILSQLVITLNYFCNDLNR